MNFGKYHQSTSKVHVRVQQKLGVLHAQMVSLKTCREPKFLNLSTSDKHTSLVVRVLEDHPQVIDQMIHLTGWCGIAAPFNHDRIAQYFHDYYYY